MTRAPSGAALLCAAAVVLLAGCKAAPQGAQGAQGARPAEPQAQARAQPPQAQPQPPAQQPPRPPAAEAPRPAAAPAAAARAEGSAAAEATRLAAMVNAQRAQADLPPVPFSRSLTRVAELHVRDLQAHRPSGSCNMHSWSAAGPWTPCCYTGDHAQARCMWSKPAEITGGKYRGHGFEISSWSSGRVTPEVALDGWRRSGAHFAVIMNQGIWASSTWRAMGVGLSENYAVVWFGTEADPDR